MDPWCQTNATSLSQTGNAANTRDCLAANKKEEIARCAMAAARAGSDILARSVTKQVRAHPVAARHLRDQNFISSGHKGG